MKVSRYRIYLMYESDKIIDFAIYDSFYEFIADHNTLDAINYSFAIDEELYRHLISLQKTNNYFYRHYSLHEFVDKFGLEEVLV